MSDTPELTPEQLAQLEELYGTGESISRRMSDNYNEIELDNSGWVEALDEWDRKRDLTEFLFQLKRLVPDPVKRHIDDFFDRWQLKPRKGKGKKTPSYRIYSKKDEHVAFACDAVRQYIAEEGMSREAALTRVVSEFRITRGTLETAYKGKRGSMRRTSA
jgi:hypothetical protein